MNKVDYCINNIRALGNSPEIFDAVHEFLIVDQGSSKVQEHEEFEEAVKPLAGKFRIINQGNLGRLSVVSHAVCSRQSRTAAIMCFCLMTM